MQQPSPSSELQPVLQSIQRPPAAGEHFPSAGHTAVLKTLSWARLLSDPVYRPAHAPTPRGSSPARICPNLDAIILVFPFNFLTGSELDQSVPRNGPPPVRCLVCRSMPDLLLPLDPPWVIGVEPEQPVAKSQPRQFFPPGVRGKRILLSIVWRHDRHCPAPARRLLPTFLHMLGRRVGRCHTRIAAAKRHILVTGLRKSL